MRLRFYWRDILSFEAIFLLFVFAGVFKATDFFAGINEHYDLTVATAVLGMMCGLVLFLCRNISASPAGWSLLACYLVYLIYAAASYLTGEYASEEATVKIQKLAVFNTWGLVASVFLINSRARVERFLRLFFLLAIVLGFDALLRSKGEELARAVGALGVDSYQALGNLMALGVEIALIAIIFEVSRRGRIVLGAAIAGLILAMMLSGARQALAGLLVTSAFLACSLPNTKLASQFIRRYLPMVVLLPLIFVVFRTYFFNDLDVSWGVNRIFQVFYDPGEDILDESGRTLIWQDGMELWRKFPFFGAGFGSFREAAIHPDYRHPHNMFIEYLCELGFVGLLLGCGMWWVVFRHLLQRKRLATDPLFLTVCIMWLHTVTAAQFSGDIADNRFMFMMAGLIVSLPPQVTRRQATKPAAAVGRSPGVGINLLARRGAL
ncbi:MAG: O-antigen ligase family protein [Pirellulales bacterium]|nr:O-antigen ligase family protein [Pirellulales bacterium]